MGFLGSIPRAPIIQIDPDTIRIEDLLDTDLSHYFDITIDDVNHYVLFNPKIGDLRIQDPDDATDADYIQFTTDPASGGFLQKSSRITDGNIWDIDHNGTISGATATVDITEINIDLNGLTIDDGAANAVSLTPIFINASIITATAVGLSSFEGIWVVCPTTGEYNTETGIHIDAVKGDADNDAVGLDVGRDLNAAITADRAYGGDSYTARITQAASNSSAGDFDLDQPINSGCLFLGLQHNAITTVGAKTDPDTFAATALNIDIDATTNNANTKLDANPRAIDIEYTLTEILGELRMAATDIIRVSATIPNGLTSAGAFQLDMFEINADGVVLNDANITFNMLNLDFSGITDTAMAKAAGINITSPTGRIPAIDTNARGLISGRIEQGAYYFYDHFWGRAKLSQWTTRITTGAVGGAPTSTDLNGVLEMLTGGAATNEESLDWNDIFTFQNTLRPTFECKIWLSDVDNDTNVAVGLVNINIGNGQAGLALNQGGALNQDFVIIEMSHTTHTTTNWNLSCQCDGVSTVDAGAAAAATTWTVLRFEFISDTSIEWFVDGVSQGIISSNVPTDALQPILFVLTDANVTKAIEIDSVKIWQDIA